MPRKGSPRHFITTLVMKLQQHTNHLQGFTLIELVIYLSIFSIFLSFSIPTSVNLYQRTQQRIIQDSLGSAVRQARLLAITQGVVLVLAPCSEAKNWSDGIGLYSFQAFKHKPRSKPIYQWHWPSKFSQVTWHGFQSQEALYFMPDARHNAVNGAFAISMGAQPVMKVVVSRFGHVH